MNKKIKTREEIAEIADRLRKDAKKVVTCNGSFDIMHIGHIKFLQEAREQGDALIVGLNSDASVKRYKSSDRPINPQECRAEFLAALECVDYVTLFDETDPIALLSVIKPDVHVNGIEYGEDCIEAETVRQNGGRLHLVPLFKDYSTTNMIKKIIKAYADKPSKE
jgi:rfaE bifunctional protein nucleotidyltransferase chain/domain